MLRAFWEKPARKATKPENGALGWYASLDLPMTDPSDDFPEEKDANR